MLCMLVAPAVGHCSCAMPGLPGAPSAACHARACAVVSSGCPLPRIHCLQTLDLGGGVTPRGVAEVGGADSPAFLVSEEEQAALYAGWAQAALLKFRWVLRPLAALELICAVLGTLRCASCGGAGMRAAGWVSVAVRRGRGRPAGAD